MREKLRQPIPDQFFAGSVGPELREEDFVSSYGEEVFKADVDKVKEYILAGDVMQVVLSQRMAVKLEASPLDLIER